jgi:hypothetical protein
LDRGSKSHSPCSQKLEIVVTENGTFRASAFRPLRDNPVALQVRKEARYAGGAITMGSAMFDLQAVYGSMNTTQVWMDRILGVCVFVAAFAAVIGADSAGMPQKWHAAILGTLVPFAAIISIRRTSWSRPSFWTTLGACFVANLLLIYIFFEFCPSERPNFWLDLVGAGGIYRNCGHSPFPACDRKEIESQMI